MLIRRCLNSFVHSSMVDDVFNDLRNLTALQLSHNRLEHVRPAMFSGLRSLVRLDLADNRIGSVPPGSLRHLPRLRQLRLDGNRLMELRRCAVPKRVRLRSLSVVGNPIRYDCRSFVFVIIHSTSHLVSTCSYLAVITIYIPEWM